ncbi:MAG: hypothetical protein ACLP8Y_06910 [Thermoplasmata archaeon]
MNVSLLASGILLVLAGIMVLAFIQLYPQAVRREKRRVGSLTQRARDAGLRGQYSFDQDRSKWDTVGGFGTYGAVDMEDRALYEAVGSKIESESAFFSKAGLWTDARLAWVGVPAVLIGAVACIISAYG